MPPTSKPAPAQQRPIQTPRSVDTTEVDQKVDAFERAVGYVAEIAKLHYAHNEVRRLVPLALEALIEHLQEMPTASKPKRTKKKEESDGTNDSD